MSSPGPPLSRQRTDYSGLCVLEFLAELGYALLSVVCSSASIRAWNFDACAGEPSSRRSPGPHYKDLDNLWLFHHILVMSDAPIKPVSWIGSSYKDFRAFPDPVQDLMGYALYRAQVGAKHDHAKPLQGFGGAGVLEIVADHVGDTFRAIYTVKFATAIYVLHAFQKKSKASIKTPREELELIRRRLKAAEADYQDRLGKGTRS